MKIIDYYIGQVKEMINFVLNDYFNFIKYLRIIKVGIEVVKKYGIGVGFVLFFGGIFDIYVEFEKKFVKFKGCEDVLIYISGYGLNLGIILVILYEKDVVIFDMYVYVSIIDGCRNINVEFFRYNNMDFLEKVLKKVKDKYNIKFVIVDGVYFMDGDIVLFDQIVEIVYVYGVFVMVDEVYVIGVIGKNGRGIFEYCNVEGKVDIVVGILFKVFGVVGGFIVINKEFVNYLYFYLRVYMFLIVLMFQVIVFLIEVLNVIEEELEFC